VIASDVLKSQPLADQLHDLAASRALSKRARIGLQHFTINPRSVTTTAQRDALVSAILEEFGADQHPHVLIEHSGKARAKAGGWATHWHLIVAHTGPNGRSLRLSNSFARLESIARRFEWTHENKQLTQSRHAIAVADRLERAGNGLIAQAVRAEVSTAAPSSRMTSASRGRVARHGADLPLCVAEIERLWRTARPLTEMMQRGYELKRGMKHGVIIVVRDGLELGALHRMVRETKSLVAARLGVEMAKENINGTGQKRRSGAAANRATDPKECRGVAHDDGRALANVGRGRRGIDRPGPIASGRGKARLVTLGTTTTRLRDSSSLTAIRRAEIAGRVRRGRGQLTVDQLRDIKVQLWTRIVGAAIPPEVAAALSYVDVAARVARLTTGGWIRDEGDTLYASSGDPAVVVVMVASMKAKGWRTVRLWGDTAFILEAKRQLAEAGIDVVDDEAPPRAASLSVVNNSLVEELCEKLRAEQNGLGVRLFEIGDALRVKPEPAPLKEALLRKRTAAWDAFLAQDEAKMALEAATKAAAAANFFSRKRLKIAEKEAADRFESAAARYRDTSDEAKRFEARGVRASVRDADAARHKAAELEATRRLLTSRLEHIEAILAILNERPEAALSGTEALDQMAERSIKSAKDKKGENESDLDQATETSGFKAPKP
jgi:hypothetical protein